jgi:hypothetical protein
LCGVTTTLAPEPGSTWDKTAECPPDCTKVEFKL